MQAKQKLFCDIETLSNPEACALAPEPVVTAPSNYKDPEKIKEYVERETAARKAELLDRAALDPDYGQILSIGMSVGEEVTVFVNQCLYDVEWFQKMHLSLPANVMYERTMLNLFWKTFADCEGRCVGYNILGFDLPFLMRRSMALGIVPPVVPNLARYRTEPITDLMQILYNWGAEKYKGLKQVCRLYDIPNDCPGADGAMVKDMDPEKLIAYQVSDVKLVMKLYERMNGIYFDHGNGTIKGAWA